MMDPETGVSQVADSEDLVILARTIFYWSTRVMDGQTDSWTDRTVIANMRYSSTCCHV